MLAGRVDNVALDLIWHPEVARGCMHHDLAAHEAHHHLAGARGLLDVRRARRVVLGEAGEPLVARLDAGFERFDFERAHVGGVRDQHEFLVELLQLPFGRVHVAALAYPVHRVARGPGGERSRIVDVAVADRVLEGAPELRIAHAHDHAVGRQGGADGAQPHVPIHGRHQFGKKTRPVFIHRGLVSHHLPVFDVVEHAAVRAPGAPQVGAYFLIPADGLKPHAVFQDHFVFVPRPVFQLAEYLVDFVVVPQFVLDPVQALARFFIRLPHDHAVVEVLEARFEDQGFLAQRRFRALAEGFHADEFVGLAPIVQDLDVIGRRVVRVAVLEEHGRGERPVLRQFGAIRANWSATGLEYHDHGWEWRIVYGGTEFQPTLDEPDFLRGEAIVVKPSRVRFCRQEINCDVGFARLVEPLRDGASIRRIAKHPMPRPI